MLSFRRLYVSLLFLRVLIAFTGTSIIHPDEHFQHTDIAASDVFGLSSVGRTWEWDPARSAVGPEDGWFALFSTGPVRSVAPIWLTSGLAFKVVKALFLQPTPRTLLIAQRPVFLLLSLLQDRLLFSLLAGASSQHQRSTYQTVCLLLATSPATLAFLTRPFSNTIETALLGVAWLLTLRIRTSQRPMSIAFAFGVVAALGVWTRVTYVVFALPVGLLAAYRLFYRSIPALLVGLVSAPASAAGLVILDSWYFGKDLSNWRELTVTPLALMAYNVRHENLALHGLHPRWLHLLVNGPILFGPAWFLALLYAVSSARLPVDDWIFCATLGSALPALSLQPHQEPRFLLPLTAPVFMLAGKALSRIRWPLLRRVVWTAHLLHAFSAVAFFGYVHQGGIIPSLCSTTPHLSLTSGNIRLISWKTFGIPRSLAPSTASVIDLAGADPTSLISTICSPVRNQHEIVLLAPRWALHPAQSSGILERLKLVPVEEACVRGCGVHIDMDRLDEVIRGGWEDVGVGIWRAGCAKPAGAAM